MKETINICIVHYNTPLLTECLVKSINKFMPNSKIYIFDNSDMDPFVYRQDNIIYFDNTKGQIINFDEWLKKYPNRNKSIGKNNNWGSVKHAYSIQNCVELINDDFILLDSDVLLKRDISSFVDNSVVTVGKTECQTTCKSRQHSIKRLLPFMCFLNVKMMNKYGVLFFYENYMHGLHITRYGDLYDTGASFLKSIEDKNLEYKEVDIYDYIVHLGSASWENSASISDWLKKYENLYEANVIV